MRPEVFQFSDYKQVLKSVLSAPEVKRGYARELAEAAGCQRSYLSSVVHGHIHLTPDHACGLVEHWRLSSSEAEYFLLLVDLARSATPRLKKRISEKLKSLKTEHENIAKRLGRPALETHHEGAMYYSSWMWSAVHILVSIPKFQEAREISKKLGVPEEFILNLLRSLEGLGLVKRVNSRWVYGSGSVHVPRESPLVNLHHSNWRQQAVLHSQIRPGDGVHYTTVTAMSEAAYEQIKTLVLGLIDESSRMAGPSASEELVAFNLDFFKP